MSTWTAVWILDLFESPSLLVFCSYSRYSPLSLFTLKCPFSENLQWGKKKYYFCYIFNFNRLCVWHVHTHVHSVYPFSQLFLSYWSVSVAAKCPPRNVKHLFHDFWGTGALVSHCLDLIDFHWFCIFDGKILKFWVAYVAFIWSLEKCSGVFLSCSSCVIGQLSL